MVTISKNLEKKENAEGVRKRRNGEKKPKITVWSNKMKKVKGSSRDFLVMMTVERKEPGTKAFLMLLRSTFAPLSEFAPLRSSSWSLI